MLKLDDENRHYGRLWLCRAAKLHGKGRYMLDARQRPHGEGLPGKGFFAVRLHQNARQSLCRAASSLPSATTRRRAVDVAVRRLHLPCVGLCRAPSRRTHGKDLLFAVRHPTARTAKAVSLPCAPVHPHGKEPTRHTPGQPQHCLCRADSQPGTPQASRNTVSARQSYQMVLYRAHTHGKGPGDF